MIPWKQNCPHSPEGWCLKCVSELGDASLELKTNIEYYFHPRGCCVDQNDIEFSIMRVGRALHNGKVIQKPKKGIEII